MRHPVRKHGWIIVVGLLFFISGEFFPVREIRINPSKPALYLPLIYRMHSPVGDITVRSRSLATIPSYSSLRRSRGSFYIYHDIPRWRATLYSRRSPEILRASVNRDSFFPDGLRDSVVGECRRTTLRSERRDSDLGHGTEPYDSSSWPSDLFPDTFYRGAAASRVVVTYERESTLLAIDPLRFRWPRDDLSRSSSGAAAARRAQ